MFVLVLALAVKELTPGGVPVDGGIALVRGRAEGYDGETLVKGHTGHHSR